MHRNEIILYGIGPFDFKIIGLDRPISTYGTVVVNVSSYVMLIVICSEQTVAERDDPTRIF